MTQDSQNNPQEHAASTSVDKASSPPAVNANASLDVTGLPVKALRFLGYRALGLPVGKALANVNASSEELWGWKQDRRFRQLDLDIADIAMRMPELAKRLLSVSSLAVASSVIDRALGNSSQAQRAAETVLEATGIIGTKVEAVTINAQAQQLVQNITLALQNSSRDEET